MGSESPDYYPFRWKVADAVEDLFVLHRRKLIAGVLVVLTGLAIGAFLFVDDGADPVDTAAESTTTDPPPETSTASTLSSTSTVAPTTSTNSTTTTTTEATTSTTTTEPASSRPVPTPEQIAAAQPGAILELSPGSIALVGGLPSDAVATETMTLAEAIFDGAEVLDRQIVDESFPTPENIVFRLSAPDLFGYNSDDLNPVYLPLIDQLAAAIIAAENWTVNVVGHTDDIGPEAGNQRLSEGRAQAGADRLVIQGVDATRVDVTGAGESEPIAPNDTEAGRLANRRIEFVVSS